MTERPLAPLVAPLASAGLVVSVPPGPVPVSGVTADSRAVRPGWIYVAVRGSAVDGHRFVPEAVRAGAAAVVVEEPSGGAVPEVVVRDGRRAAQLLGRAWFGDPGSRLTLIGITGTNGKTTTTALVRHLLNAGGTTGSIGTLGAFDGRGDPIPSIAGNLTTPGPIDLQETLAALVDRGATQAAMEASSHSLAQGRLDGLAFAAGVFTNLTRDHLDYHGTMEAYREAKLLLRTLLRPDGVEVLNADDPAWDLPPGPVRRVRFGLASGADLRATGISLAATGTRFRMEGRFGTAEVALPLLGAFNVSNALAAGACALELGVSLAGVVERLVAAPQVPGRMERIADRPCVVLRDYAHTPDALARALETLRPLTAGRLIVVFGCGGDRDRGKRPEMGRIAAEVADVAIVTSDNPRTEDPERILADVAAGMGEGPHRMRVDRREAIAEALSEARADDTVLLAGKGHETYQVIGTEKLPFDEREIVQSLVGSA